MMSLLFALALIVLPSAAIVADFMGYDILVLSQRWSPHK
jgi:hypothetical protein